MTHHSAFVRPTRPVIHGAFTPVAQLTAATEVRVELLQDLRGDLGDRHMPQPGGR